MVKLLLMLCVVIVITVAWVIGFKIYKTQKMSQKWRKYQAPEKRASVTDTAAAERGGDAVAVVDAQADQPAEPPPAPAAEAPAPAMAAPAPMPAVPVAVRLCPRSMAPGCAADAGSIMSAGTFCNVATDTSCAQAPVAQDSSTAHARAGTCLGFEAVRVMVVFPCGIGITAPLQRCAAGAWPWARPWPLAAAR